jgi:hypothetical protein
MFYLFGYRLRFKNVEDKGVTVSIWDTQSMVEVYFPPRIIDLEGGENPLVISSVDTSEDKFTPIRAKEANITFRATNNTHLIHFASGADDRWLVEIRRETQIIFKGYLIIDDLSMPLLPPENEEVTLRATDQLGTLKEQEWLIGGEEVPRGKYKMIHIIAECLKRTNLFLPINIAWNYHEQNKPTEFAWDNIYLDAKTFEKEIGTREDCYTVISKILGMDGFLHQHKGEWWIGHYDEYESGLQYIWRYTGNGDFVSYSVATLSQDIDVADYIDPNGPMFFCNEDQEVNLTRPYKKVTLTYNYDYPKEIVDNIDFERGNFISAINIIPYTAYTVEDWTQKKGYGTFETFPSNSAYIRKKIVNGYEEERVLVLTYTASNSPQNRLQSNPVQVSAKDKIDVSIDFRFASNTSGTGSYTVNIMLVRLVADDGTFYIMDSTTGKWKLSTSNYTANFSPWQYIWNTGDPDIDETQWETASIQGDEIPKDGNVYIDLFALGQVTGGADDVDIYYQNLRFDYKPLINGSYQKYNGLSHSISQNGNYKAVLDEQVYISNSPKPLFKGAFFRLVSGKYQLAGNWYNGYRWTTGLPSPDFIMPFARLQAYSVWKQYKRQYRIINGSVQGLQALPDSTSIYIMQHASPYTGITRRFLLLSFSQNYYTCEWTGSFAEMFDVLDPVGFPDVDVKYI